MVNSHHDSRVHTLKGQSAEQFMWSMRSHNYLNDKDAFIYLLTKVFPKFCKYILQNMPFGDSTLFNGSPSKFKFHTIQKKLLPVNISNSTHLA